MFRLFVKEKKKYTICLASLTQNKFYTHQTHSSLAAPGTGWDSGEGWYWPPGLELHSSFGICGLATLSPRSPHVTELREVWRKAATRTFLPLSLPGSALKVRQTQLTKLLAQRARERGILYSAHVSFGINTCRRELPAAPCSAPLLTPAALGSELDFGNPALPNTTKFGRILAILTMQAAAVFAYTTCCCLPAGGKALGCSLWEPLTCPPAHPSPGFPGCLNLEQLKWTQIILQEKSPHLWQERAHGITCRQHSTRQELRYISCLLSYSDTNLLIFHKPFESMSLQACEKV